MESSVSSLPIHILHVPLEPGVTRLDQFIVQQFPLYSRTFFQKLIDQDLVTLNGKKTKASMAIKPHDAVAVTFPPARLVIPTWSAQAAEILKKMEVKVVFKHEHFLIISKPAHVMVHKPNQDHTALTLVDWLLYHFSYIADVGQPERPGIVHRLDKDTSGLMVIPTTAYAHALFGNMFKDRAISKTYMAVVEGNPPAHVTIDFPIARDPFVPVKMAVNNTSGRAALTHITTEHAGATMAVIIAKPVTGRTHQIRVHCAASGFAIVGDTVYGKKSSLITRQALHAVSLSFTFEGKHYSFTDELSADIINLITSVRLS